MAELIGVAFYVSLAAIGLLLVAAAYFSLAETALTGASRPRMHQLAQEGERRAIIAKALQEDRERTIGALLLGNNLANIASSALATGVLIGLFGDAGVVYATVVMTALVLVFAEVMPKTYALNHADDVALWVAPSARIIVALLSPLANAVRAIVRTTLRLFGATLPLGSTIVSTEEELRGVIDLHKGPEPEVKHERAMLQGILDLDTVTVGRVMTHRRNLIAIDADEPPAAVVEQVLQSKHMRVPLWRGQQDNVVGVLDVESLAREMVAKGGDAARLDMAQVTARPWFVPESTTLLDQLQAFRRTGERFALVVDEYGALMGAVTLKDILEEIVGGTDRQRESPVPGVRPQGDNSYVIDGSVTIRDLNREFEWDLPDAGAATIAGLVLHEARAIPQVGQVFSFHGFRFEILRRNRNQIAQLRVTPPKRAAA